MTVRIEKGYTDYQVQEGVLVLGTRRGSGNIGDAIVSRFEQDGRIVGYSDCETDGVYRAPFSEDLAEYSSLVVSLGFASFAPFGERETDEALLREIIEGSLLLPLECVRRYVLARRRMRKGGRIILIGSYAHDHVLSGSAPYCAAKAGLAHAVRALGWDLAPDFVISIVHPYHVPDTPLGERTVKWMVEDRGMTREEAEQYQRKDLRQPEHLGVRTIAEHVHRLLTMPQVEAAWLSGQGINLYGGTR